MSEATPSKARLSRSDRFLRAVADCGQVVVVTHDNPDPDAIAAGWALCYLVQQRLGIKARLMAGGAIVRAENLRMVELLNPPLELVESIDMGTGRCFVFVDCSPTAANHLLRDEHLRAAAVIDHHQQTGPRFRTAHRDIRKNVASSSTIVSCYLQEQNLDPSPELATALLYGIHTDALGWTLFTRTDHRIVTWLNARADLNKFSDIQSAPLVRDYYADLLLALENTFLYDRAAICFLPQAHGSEIVGEVADLLIRCKEVDVVLCAAVIGEDVLLSVRSAIPSPNANELVNSLLEGIGHGGGHTHRAGGKIVAAKRSAKISEDVQAELRTRWLVLCKADQQRGTRLVAKREIIGNL